MPQISIHRKAKRPLVLAKRTQYLKKYYRERSYRPLYEKLKNNNSYLAKALTQEKQNCQSFFSQNIALIAELQELRLMCTSQDNAIANVLSNSNEILKMLVTMSGYVTNTISICQEFVSSSANSKQTSMSSGNKEIRRLSSKSSPARGVVKPMISGHTIKKPTINLSRVNIEHINNTTRLSNIQEESTSHDRSPEVNETRSPISVSIPITQLRRYESEHTYRLPERLAVSPRRVNNAVIANDNQRRRRKSHHSQRISESYSRSKSYSKRSNKWSGENVQNRTESENYLSSPRVKLNDVSKLLRNSQTINIRTLIDHNVNDIESQESNENTPNDTSIIDVIPETSMSDEPDNENETYVQAVKNSDTQRKRKNIEENLNGKSNVSDNSRLSQSNTDYEDPLEGPSWLLDIEAEPSQNDKFRSDDPNGSIRAAQNTSTAFTYSNKSSDLEDIEEELSDMPNLTYIQTPRKDLSPIIHHVENDSSFNSTITDGSFCEIFPTSNQNRSSDNVENDNAANLSSFITMRHNQLTIKEEDDIDDFTLLLKRRSMRNMNFDINELRLPVLEGSMINSNVTSNVNDEVTTAIQRITDFQIPSISNQSMHELETDKTITTKLPMVVIHNFDRFLTPERNRYSNQMSKSKTLNPRECENHAENVTAHNKKTKQQKKKKTTTHMKNNQNPSAVKVVLEKLDASYIEARKSIHKTGSYNNRLTDTVSNQENNLDLERNANRPKRKKAPLNLKEPSLNK